MLAARLLALSFPGGWEWLVILIVILIFFGNRIPGMARALGSGISEFRSGLKEGERNKPDEDKDAQGKSGGGP